MTATYVYGLVAAGTDLPEGLTGIGPSGTVTTVRHEQLAAVVSDVPVDRPLGTREDLIAHEAVVDALARESTVLPMRFPAVVERDGVVAELLGPYQDYFVEILARLDGRVQYTLKGRYVQEELLREVLEDDEELRALSERVREMPDDAAYYERVRLGELIVAALQDRSAVDAADIQERLAPYADQVTTSSGLQPDEVLTAAFLVERASAAQFEQAVEDLGRDTHEWLRLRLLGPLAPYDFVPRE